MFQKDDEGGFLGPPLVEVEAEQLRAEVEFYFFHVHGGFKEGGTPLFGSVGTSIFLRIYFERVCRRFREERDRLDFLGRRRPPAMAQEPGSHFLYVSPKSAVGSEMFVYIFLPIVHETVLNVVPNPSSVPVCSHTVPFGMVIFEYIPFNVALASVIAFKIVYLIVSLGIYNYI